MKLLKKSIAIMRNFGISHFLRRVSESARARLDEYRRNRLHSRIVSRIGAGTHEITCLGKKFLIDTEDSGLHRDLLTDRIREPIATSLLLCNLQKDDVFLDIGANIGYYSIILADLCDKVYALEPCRKNYIRLQENIRLNKITNINSYNVAASDDSKPLILDRSSKSNWHRTRKGIADNRSIAVDAISVDDFCRKNNITPTIMKLDVEGFEKHIFAGSKITLSKVRYLFFELHGSILEIDEISEIINVIKCAGLTIDTGIRYDRPGLWIDVGESAIDKIVNGDFGVYELLFHRPLAP